MNCQDPACAARLSWFRDRVLKRRGYYLGSRWYCSEVCLATAVAARLEKKSLSREGSSTSPFQVKFEHILIANGAISREQLNKALTEPNQDKRGRLSHHLMNLGLITERDVTAAYGRLFNIPVVNLKSCKINPNVLNIIPAEIVRNHSFFPLEIEPRENRLVLVTHDPADLSVMVNLRGILNCQVAAYVSDESIVRDMIEQYCRLSSELLADDSAAVPGLAQTTRDIARWIARRAKTIDARSLQICRLDQYIWTRFVVGHKPQNFVLPDAKAV